MKTKGLIPRLWRRTKRVLIVLFLLHFVYILILKWVNPPITLTQIGSLISGDGLKRDYIDIEDMSPYAKLAFMSAEDQKFPDHNGFDWKSIGKAMDYNKRNPNKVRGASTISQQVAKNVFLWQGKSWFRKGLEAYFTFMIEVCWGKKRILEVYLNSIEMGDGIFGIEKAAQIYFGKSAKNLSRQEAAMIAACLPNPKRYKVKPPSPYIMQHSLWVTRQMGFIEPDPDIQKIIK